MEIIPVMVITVPFSEQTLYVYAFLCVIKSKSNPIQRYTLKILKSYIFWQ